MRPLPNYVRRLLWSLGVLYAIYLVAGNIFLNSSLAAAIVNRKPQTFQAQWAWAWTAWPGQIHVHGLSLGGHARKLLWRAHGESADGRVMLWPLFRHELRFGTVIGSAVTVDVQPTAADHKPPPYRHDAWHITAGRISTGSLRRLRWGELEVDGEGSGELGFTHQLRGGATQIFPSRIVMPDARVRYRRWTLLHEAKLDLRFAFDPFTHEQPPGWQKARRAVGRLTLDAATMAVALGADRGGAQAALASPPAGHVSADIRFDHGTLVPGGRLQWDAPVAITDADGSQQRRRGQLDVAVRAAGLTLDVRVPPPAGAAGARAMNQLRAHLAFASRRLLPSRSPEDDLRLLSGSVAGRWHFESLRWLTPLTASKPWLRLDGEGDIDAALRLDAGRLAAGSRIDVPRVALQVAMLGNVLAGDASARVRVAGDATVRTQLDVDRFTLAPADSPQQPYLRGRALQVTTQSSAGLAQWRDTLGARLHFADAQVPDLRAYNHYLPGKSLHFLAGHGLLDTDLSVDGKGNVSAGHLQLRSKGARFALGVSRLSGNLQLDTRLAQAKRGAGRVFDLDHLSLGLDGVHVDGSRDPPWWARFTIVHGQLDWNRPMRLRGDATMVMKDVSLLLSLFADRSAFPKWIASVIDAGQATAHARVGMQQGDFVLDHLVASNRRIDLFAHLRVRDGQPGGDLYARWGVLGLGVALADGKRKFHLLHARRWYQSQPDLIAPQATSAK